MECDGNAGLFFAGGRLHVANPGLLRLLRRDRGLSPSTFSALESCPARWVGDKIFATEQTLAGMEATQIGSAVHKILEDMYGCGPQDRTPAVFDQMLCQLASEVWAGQPMGKTAEWMREVGAAGRGIFTIEDPAAVQPLAREQQIQTIIASVPVNGFIDRLDATDAGIVVTDYKTGRKPYTTRWDDHYGDQLRIYGAGIEALTGVRPAAGQLLYTRLGRRFKPAWNQAAFTDTLTRLQTVWDGFNRMYASGTFDTRPGPLCGWCPLVGVCEANKHQDNPRADMTGKAINPDVFNDPPRAHYTSMNNDFLIEDKPWVAGSLEGINPAGYAANTLVECSMLAEDALIQQGWPLTRSYVTALARVLAQIVGNVSERFTGSRAPSTGTSKLAVRTLATELGRLPIPGENAGPNAWSAWKRRVEARITGHLSVAFDMWDNPPEEANIEYVPLAGDGSAAQ